MIDILAVALIVIGLVTVFAALIEFVARCVDRWEDGRTYDRERDAERRELRHRCWHEVIALQGAPE